MVYQPNFVVYFHVLDVLHWFYQQKLEIRNHQGEASALGDPTRLCLRPSYSASCYQPGDWKPETLTCKDGGLIESTWINGLWSLSFLLFAETKLANSICFVHKKGGKTRAAEERSLCTIGTRLQNIKRTTSKNNATTKTGRRINNVCVQVVFSKMPSGKHKLHVSFETS